MPDKRIEAALVAYLERLGSEIVVAQDLVPFVRAVCRSPEYARAMLPKAARTTYDHEVAGLDPAQLNLFDKE